MGSLKEIKGRIASVRSTQKITSAMRMVASAKMHRTQSLTQNFLRYSSALRSVTEQLGYRPQADGATESVLLIPISSSSGLCGAFNSNIAKATVSRIQDYKRENVSVSVMPIGKKIIKEMGKLPDIRTDLSFGNLNELVEKGDVFAAIQSLIATLQQMFTEGRIQKAEVVYHHFISMGKQVIETRTLPLQPPCTDRKERDDNGTDVFQDNQTTEGQSGNAGDTEYITEPSAPELLRILHPRMLNAEMYGLLLDAIASEHAARMMAMQTADDNANELLQELTLLYNKTRQQSITNELIDIMGGKIAQ